MKQHKTLYDRVMCGTEREVHKILKTHEYITTDNNYTDYDLLLGLLYRKRIKTAKVLLNHGCRVIKQPLNHVFTKTPLHLAVQLNDINLVKILLEKKAALDAIDENGESPLHLAIKNNHFDIADLCLSAINIDYVDVKKYQLSYFHIATMRNNIGLVKTFLKRGVDVNCLINFGSVSWYGFTALHFAVDYNYFDIVQCLLNQNADITIKNANNQTPLHIAVKKKYDNIVNAILNSVSSNHDNPVDENGLSHFHVACMKHNLNAVKKYLQHGVDINHVVNSTSCEYPGFSALHFAVKGKLFYTNI